MNIYKIKYQWVEDDNDEHLVFTKLNKEEFEDVLKSATIFLNQSTIVEDCLPRAYFRLQEFLKDKECYIGKYFDMSDEYYLNDTMTTPDGNRLNFYIDKRIHDIKWENL